EVRAGARRERREHGSRAVEAEQRAPVQRGVDHVADVARQERLAQALAAGHTDRRRERARGVAGGPPERLRDPEQRKAARRSRGIERYLDQLALRRSVVLRAEHEARARAIDEVQEGDLVADDLDVPARAVEAVDRALSAPAGDEVDQSAAAGDLEGAVGRVD